MRTAGMPNFRKTWGKIAEGLTVGNYIVSIDNRYDMSYYNGKKTFVISTTNYLGGKNYFLAISYLVVGIMCGVMTVVLIIAYMNKKR